MLGFALGEHHDAQLVYGAMAVAVRGVIMHTDQGSEYTAGAFHAACARLSISRSPPSVLLRENYRESGKVKNRTLANLSAWPEHKVEALSRALKGLPPAGLDGTFVVARSLPHGHVATVLGTIRQLGLEELIDAAPSRARNLVAVMITAAVIDGSSKLATARGCGRRPRPARQARSSGSARAMRMTCMRPWTGWGPASRRSRTRWPPGTWSAGRWCSMTCPRRRPGAGPAR